MDPAVSIRIVRSQPFWNLHSHSRYSANDALPQVADMVAAVKEMGQPALGLTDHGNTAGSVQLYKECKSAEIKPFPGSELYIVHDRGDKKAKRHHMCVVAYTSQGYENLVNLSTQSFKNFYHKPLLDPRDLAELSEAGKLKGIAATSGCYFGLISQSIVQGNFGTAESYVKSMSAWFDKYYIELQSHNIDHDDDWTDQKIVDQLIDLADQVGLPCVLTQDAHYIKQEEKYDHEVLKRLVSFGTGDDGTFPGDGFGLADEQWIREHHTVASQSRGFAGLSELLDLHDISIPELDSYHYNVPFTVADPEQELRTFCEQKLNELDLPKKYWDLLQEELDVITFARMAGYLLTVKEITDWCRKETIYTTTRGSASGSLVCWLLEITQIDPIKWGLRYERFVSRDRTKPPDIDLDVEHTERQRLIEWLGERFAVAQIGTYTTYSLSGEDKGGKGSLRVKYFARKRATGQPINDWSEVPVQDKNDLYRIGERKLISNYGVHPAGFVVTTTESDLRRLVPMMHVASSGAFVTQYDGEDVEKLGYVKLDVLGLKTLTILNKARQNLGRDDLDWIPFNDSSTFKTIRSGNTAGVFQLEGGSAKRGCIDLKPTKISDVIDAMALFRPAALNTGATARFIDRKSKIEEIPERHPILMKATGKTQGIMIFQEQVITILRDLGMEPDPLTKFLTAVKASNKSVNNAQQIIDDSKSAIAQLCYDNGMSKEEFEQLWADIEGFAAYGFNKAHSTAYGIAAYKCAYLSTHHPIEFFGAVLNVAAGNPDKEPMYIAAARKNGVRIRPPHVNYSGESYEVDHRHKCIRKGLLSIRGVGAKAADAIVSVRPKGGFNSIESFCELVNHRKVTGIKAYATERDSSVGTFGVLWESRAFEDIK